MTRTIVSRPTKPAAKPVTPILIGALRPKLDAAHLAMDRLDKVIMVAVTVLCGQDTDLDSSIATLLENAVEAELNSARECIVEALEMLQEVANAR